MDNIKSDAYYIDRMIKDMSFIIGNMNDISSEDFAKHELLQDSMMFRLIQISENAKRLTDEYKEDHADIPWTAIYGLRNKIVHEYGNVDLTVVYDTLSIDIPWLHKIISES